MNRDKWLNLYYDRERRYIRDGSMQDRLDQQRVIAITCDSNRLNRFDTQVALITAANLFGRMNSKIVLAFEDVPLNSDLPWSASSLHEFLISQMERAFPFGKFLARRAKSDEFCIHYGCDGNGFVFDGTGWNSYLGSNPSNINELPDGNMFGAAFSVILAAQQFYKKPFEYVKEDLNFNTLHWNCEFSEEINKMSNVDIGKIHFIGLGSVGSSVLYYLTLNTRKFEPTLIDKKRVRIHNLSRSPIFSANDCINEDVNPNQNEFKVNAAENFLKNAGMSLIKKDHTELHRSRHWLDRNMGEPDLVVSAANENNVRRCIEYGYPPIQIYATTGQNWQITLLRHLPNENSCSLCVFNPSNTEIQYACATNSKNYSENLEVDSALPFLSFGAGLMTACEIAKLSLSGFPFANDQVFLNLLASPNLVNTKISHLDGCECEQIESYYHNKIISGSRYSTLK